MWYNCICPDILKNQKTTKLDDNVWERSQMCLVFEYENKDVQDL